MFEHILVPLDGSQLAEDILVPVTALGRNLGSRITLIHVLERDARARIHGEHHIVDATEAASYLGTVADRLRDSGAAVDIHVHGRPVDDVAAAIDAHAHEFGVSLVAMCKHGRSGLRQALIGSIAQRILKGGGAPILLRTPAAQGKSVPFEPKTILIPLDLEHDTTRAVAASLEVARSFGSQIRFMTALSMEEERKENVAARLLPSAAAETLRIQADEAAQRLEEQARGVEAQGVPADIAIRHEDPATAILRDADEVDAGLIVLSTHALVGLEAWLTGSTGERVITKAQRSLLLIREL